MLALAWGEIRGLISIARIVPRLALASGEPGFVGHRARSLLTEGAVGRHDFGHRPGRSGHRQAKSRPFGVPGRLDPPVWRVVHRLGPGDPAPRPGLDPEAAVGGVVVVEGDAGDVVVQEGDHRTLAVVVQRVVRASLLVDA